MVIDAILSSEDKLFYEHSGINIGATAKALIDNVRGTSSRGASTISQQFVKNVLIQQCEQRAVPGEEDYAEKLEQCWLDATNPEGNEGIQRKLQEMRYALQIEKDYSKNDILLGYLNIANFGGTTYGIEAAANLYFGKKQSRLTVAEAATLAGIVQNPNTYRIDKPEGSSIDRDGNPRNSKEDGYALAKERRDYVIGRMFEDGKITKEQYDEALATPVEPKIKRETAGCVAAKGREYFCQYVKSIVETDPAFGATREERMENLRLGGFDVYTTLDPHVQKAAVDAMAEWVPASYDGMELGGAAVTLEASTGRVLAMAQNTKFTERADLGAKEGYSGLVYAADYAHGKSGGFPVGSTYKLFTLIDWLEKGRSINEVLNGRKQVFKSWTCNGAPQSNSTMIENYNDTGGSVSTVKRFTAQSLNTGYLAMATQLDVCEINSVAERMGVHLASGVGLNAPERTDGPALYDVLGSASIAPMDIAAAYATVANKGIYCTPRAIDRIVDRNGDELPLPESSCSQVISPEVAATAAFTLRDVMAAGGTGAASHPRDGVPIIGKTGTHNSIQTMMVASTTKTTTAVWVGNSKGEVRLNRQYYKGVQLSDLRHRITPVIQRAANAIYGGDSFPSPDSHLTRVVYAELPDVIGMTIDEATRELTNAGFQVNVGSPVDSDIAAGLVAAQDPAAGRVAGGAMVTISPSTGEGVAVPNVAGMAPAAALDELHAHGYSNATLGRCRTDDGMDENSPGEVTGTSPGAGEVVNKNARIRVDYRAPSCR
ncbi:transglycosylase domain-containing protein [Microbacterium sp. NIBRBAC000506063]|uniref:transglycosylase domain-containing protein n=1 Tax=Microbacterium sp. NIBRBAC000506063 TaxID=2734618 RepID=UPI0021D46051|nr:transglycosylase domain-containing protein [Microbacterium sp. NIBRBAC000506063]